MCIAIFSRTTEQELAGVFCVHSLQYLIRRIFNKSTVVTWMMKEINENH